MPDLPPYYLALPGTPYDPATAPPGAQSSATFQNFSPAQAQMAQQTGSAATSPVADRGITNNNFASETQYSTSPWVPRITRGYIQRYNPGSMQADKCYFLFNPNQLDFNYQTIEGARPLTESDVGQQSQTLGPSGITLAFVLFFDRQFEVAYRGDIQGVRQDVHALENLVGIDDFGQGFIAPQMLRFVLGTNIVFYGLLQSIQVSYVQFNQDMIPTRCTVNIGARQVIVDRPKYDNLKANQKTTKPKNATTKSTRSSARATRTPRKPAPRPITHAGNFRFV